MGTNFFETIFAYLLNMPINSYIEYNICEQANKQMQKMYISIECQNRQYYVCTDDLSKMFFIKTKKLPPVPSYSSA